MNTREGFDAARREIDERLRTLVRVTYELIGLTRLGEHPVEDGRFAAYLDRPTDEVRTLLENHTGALFTTGSATG
jgi:hypothetical protein